MKKAIISLIMIVAMIFGSVIALAANFTDNNLATMSGWSTTGGTFQASGTGVAATSIDMARATHTVTTDSSGAFTFESTWQVRNKTCDVHPGVSQGISSGDILVGYNGPMNAFIVVQGTAVKATLAELNGTDGTLDTSATYTSKITSTDGTNFTCGVYKNGALVGHTVTIAGYKPLYVVLEIENYKAITDGPIINSVAFTSESAAVSPTPTATPSATPTASATPLPPTPAKVSYDLQAIRDFYAKQPVEHMSNQSVVYNIDGTIKQVITGTTTTNATTPTVTATAQPTVKPTTTATAIPSNATAVPSTPAPTKAQSPGFEIVLATLGMIAAMALITRKKK